jgi:energy-coupling factor transporter transmembrane protein EcfT
MAVTLEGDTTLHKLKVETKIIAAMFMLLGAGIGSQWALMEVGLLSMMGVFIARVPVKKFHILSGVCSGSFLPL